MSEETVTTPATPPPLPSERRRGRWSFYHVLFLSLMVLYLAFKILLTVSRTIQSIFAELAMEIPATTMAVIQLCDVALRNGRLCLGLPPLLVATGYVLLRPQPAVQRFYVWVVWAGILSITIGLLACLLVPLLAHSAT